MNLPNESLRVWEDIGYAARQIKKWEVIWEYEVFKLDGVGGPGVSFHKKDSPHWPDPVEDINQADRFLHGSVKWDGCSNWYFDQQDRCMLHGCSQQDLLDIGEVMARCWGWTEEAMPNFEGE